MLFLFLYYSKQRNYIPLQVKYWGESVYFKCVVMYEQYFVYTVTMAYFIFFITILLFILHPFFIIVLLLSIKRIFQRWFYWTMITLCEFDQYVEWQMLPKNISLFNRSYLFLIYSLSITFQSLVYNDTIFHIFYNFYQGKFISIIKPGVIKWCAFNSNGFNSLYYWFSLTFWKYYQQWYTKF